MQSNSKDANRKLGRFFAGFMLVIGLAFAMVFYVDRFVVNLLNDFDADLVSGIAIRYVALCLTLMFCLVIGVAFYNRLYPYRSEKK